MYVCFDGIEGPLHRTVGVSEVKEQHLLRDGLSSLLPQAIALHSHRALKKLCTGLVLYKNLHTVAHTLPLRCTRPSFIKLVTLQSPGNSIRNLPSMPAIPYIRASNIKMGLLYQCLLVLILAAVALAQSSTGAASVHSNVSNLKTNSTPSGISKLPSTLAERAADCRQDLTTRYIATPTSWTVRSLSIDTPGSLSHSLPVPMVYLAVTIRWTSA